MGKIVYYILCPNFKCRNIEIYYTNFWDVKNILFYFIFVSSKFFIFFEGNLNNRQKFTVLSNSYSSFEFNQGMKYLHIPSDGNFLEYEQILTHICAQQFFQYLQVAQTMKNSKVITLSRKQNIFPWISEYLYLYFI